MQDAFAAARAATELQRVTNTEAVDRAERYFFFAGDEPGMGTPGGMAVSSPCVPNRMIRRGEVTPCLTVPRWSRPEEIPDGQRIAGSYDEKSKKMQYWLYSGPEAQVLLEAYSNPNDPTKQWGLVELTSLRGKSIEEVQALQLTRVFFPAWPELPETNEEMISVIQAKLDDLATAPRIPDELRPIFLGVGKDMLAAVEQAQAFQTNVVSQSNMRITLPSNDEKYKGDFDVKDHLFSKRTGVSLAVNSLRGNQSDMLSKVIDRLGPQQLDPNAIAAIVAATMQAMKAQEGETKPTPKAK